MSTMDMFRLNGKVCIITGGAGLLGVKHAEAVIDAGGIPVLLDIDEKSLATALKAFKGKAFGHMVDITKKAELERVKKEILAKQKAIDVLINNAADNPKMEGAKTNWSRLENFPVDLWDRSLAIGLTGSLLCSQVFGAEMAKRGKGVILNISSDLGLIAPDQRIYRKDGIKEGDQPVKPVTYSVVKHGLIGLTRYLATYWAAQGVRCNAICPGGIFNDQPADFVKKLTNLIPLGRMAGKDEYKAAVLFLISDASSYMTGSVLVIEGGRTCW
ncbi:MAG: SDR family oxidoreductase [Nanoarchaeota archaeon]